MDFSIDSDEEIVTFVLNLHETEQLEKAARNLSERQFFSILENMIDQKLSVAKLSPLLVGLSPHVFSALLHRASLSQLSPLKTEGILEPLQHQLHLFASECTDLITHYRKEGEILALEIAEINRDHFTYSDLHALHNKIRQLANRFSQTLAAIDNALALAWGTNRVDLIAKLTSLKEAAHNQFIKNVGHAQTPTETATGLFDVLDQFLQEVYTDNNSENLQDEDLALEGLAKFSLWYLKDYWEIGLLPAVHNVEELDLHTSEYADPQSVNYRQQLFHKVQTNLTLLGIGTIGELKRASIFSKPMLKEFIAKHKKQLS